MTYTIETSSVTHGYTDASGLRLHYLDFGGEGRCIVCIHGVTGHAWTWHHVASELTSVGRVIAIDMRGHGESQWSAEGAYQTDDHVPDLSALIRVLGEPVDLVGSSWGALVSIAFAARHPGSVRRLAIVDVEPSFDVGETEVPTRPRQFSSHTEVLDWEREMSPNAPDSMIEIMAAGGTRPGDAGRLVPRHDPYFFARWPFRSEDRWADLNSLTMPTLVVHAEQSFVRAEVAEKMASLVRHGSIVHIPKSGHVIPVENPGSLAAALVEFLAE